MQHTVRVRHVVRAIASLGLMLGVSVSRIGHAQQPAAPVPVETAGFVGKTTTLDTTGFSIGRRLFAPASHNATWHMHTAGQLVFAESGRGRLQIKGQPVRELAPGDSAYIPPSVMHWHGSAPNESFTMAFITMGTSTTSQGEPLTEAEYLGRK